MSSEKHEVGLPYGRQQYSVNVTHISEPDPRRHRDMHTQSVITDSLAVIKTLVQRLLSRLPAKMNWMSAARTTVSPPAGERERKNMFCRKAERNSLTAIEIEIRLVCCIASNTELLHFLYFLTN